MIFANKIPKINVIKAVERKKKITQDIFVVIRNV